MEVVVSLGGQMETRGLFGAGDQVESEVLSDLHLVVDELLLGPSRG